MASTRWNIAVSAETDQALRMFLASQGGGRKSERHHKRGQSFFLHGCLPSGQIHAGR